MAGSLLIYGATGYTGGLIAREAVRLGLAPVLAGRNAETLSPLARELGCEPRVASLEDPEGIEKMLAGVGVLLLAAGPFASTCEPMLLACLRNRIHYLDISGEIPVMDGVRGYHREALERRVMLMPGVGFDVVPSDCLALRVAQRLPSARWLRVGLSGLTVISRGSASTLVERVGRGVLIRRNGELIESAPGLLQHEFDFGSGLRRCLAVSWGDVATAYYTTGIPNIEVYCEADAVMRLTLLSGRHLAQAGALFPGAPELIWKPLMRTFLGTIASGPTLEQRLAARCSIVVEAVDARGGRAASRALTPDTYTFTARSAATLARRVLDGDWEPGFQTPARVFGAGLVSLFDGVHVEDLPR